MQTRAESWREWERLVSDRASDPLAVLDAAVKFERYFDAMKDAAVDAARAAGHTWEEIASSLGVTRQWAWKQYGKAD